MIHSKAIDVLKSFTKEELKHFNDYIRSPFHNKSKNIVKLFEVLREYHPAFAADNDTIYFKVYPGKTYSHDRMKKMMSELHRLVDNFLILLGIGRERFLSEKILLKELLSREINDYFLLRLKNLDIVSLENHQNFNDLSELEDIRIDYYLSINKGQDTSAISNNKFMYDLCYFLYQALDYMSNITVMENTYNSKIDSSKYKQLIINLSLESFTDNFYPETNEDRVVCLLSNLICMIVFPDNEIYFANAKKLFLKYFQPDETKRCNDYMLYYSSLISYCRRKVREKKLSYISEEFDLIKNKFSLINSYDDNIVCISWSDFANAVHTGIELNKIKWTENFIMQSKRNVNSSDYDYLYNYGKGLLEFKKGNFEKSLEYFSKIYFKEHLLNIAVRHQILMCYYELDLIESALAGIDSYSHLLKNSDKFNERNRLLSKYFIDMYREILKLKSNPSKIHELRLNKISVMLGNKEFSFSDRWFEMKLHELKLAMDNLASKKKRADNSKRVNKISA